MGEVDRGRRSSQLRQGRQSTTITRLVGGRCDARQISLDQWNGAGGHRRDPDGRRADQRGHAGAIRRVEPEALRDLVGRGVQLRAFSPEILSACFDAATQTYTEMSAKSESFKKVYESMRAFRNETFLWEQVADGTYDNFYSGRQLNQAERDRLRRRAPARSEPFLFEAIGWSLKAAVSCRNSAPRVARCRAAASCRSWVPAAGRRLGLWALPKLGRSRRALRRGCCAAAAEVRCGVEVRRAAAGARLLHLDLRRIDADLAGLVAHDHAGKAMVKDSIISTWIKTKGTAPQ